jgi:hypothetical protein
VELQLLAALPVQQYLSWLNTVHASLHPPGAFSSLGHCNVMLAGQRGPLHTDLPSTGTGRKSMGTLNPSMREMSKESFICPWPTVNSASVLGGWL